MTERMYTVALYDQGRLDTNTPKLAVVQAENEYEALKIGVNKADPSWVEDYFVGAENNGGMYDVGSMQNWFNDMGVYINVIEHPQTAFQKRQAQKDSTSLVHVGLKHKKWLVSCFDKELLVHDAEIIEALTKLNAVHKFMLDFIEGDQVVEMCDNSSDLNTLIDHLFDKGFDVLVKEIK